MKTTQFVDATKGRTLEAAQGERSEPEAAGRVLPEDPEVLPKATRRRFTAEYKLQIIEQADQCNESGAIGRLLRKEGLYSSLLSEWRRQRERGILQGLSPAKRGRKPAEPNPLLPEVERLRKENQRLAKKLKQAETLLDVQKKISQILELDAPEGSNS